MTYQVESRSRELSKTEQVTFSLISGSIAGATAKTVISPLDRAKINFQTTNLPYSFRNLYRFLRNTIFERGFLELFRGNSATMVRIVPYSAVQFTVNQQLKILLQNWENSKFKYFVCGSLAGITATTCTYPLDLARAKMAVTTAKNYKGIIEVVSCTCRRRGLLALYRGFLPTVIGSFFYSGIGFFVYENLKYSVLIEGGLHNSLLGGAVAGVCGQTLTYPLDIVRRRIQTTGDVKNSQGYDDGILRTFRNVWRGAGIVGGLYKGLSLNWIKGPVASGISFFIYELSYSVTQRVAYYIETK